MKTVFLVVSFLGVINCSFQERAQNSLDICRELFHKVSSESDLELIIDMVPENLSLDELNIFKAYQGVSISMMAEYCFSPITKYKYFRSGTDQLELSIKTQYNVENTYLRLLVQLSIPGLLNYDDNIEEDLVYLKENLADAELSKVDKALFIKTLLETKNEDYDLNSLKHIKID